MFQFNGLTSEVTIDATTFQHTPTLATNGHMGNAATSTIYTVPAAKKARIIACHLAYIQGTNDGTALLKINGNAVLVMRGNVGTTQGQNATLNFEFDNAPLVTAGQLVVVTTTANSAQVSGTIAYCEEDA